MNFDEILNRWDAMQSLAAKQCREVAHTTQSVSHKKANAPSLLRNDTSRHASASHTAHSPRRNVRNAANSIDCSTKNAIRNAQEKWISTHITPDKDAIADEKAERDACRSLRYLKELPPDARVDLHGFTKDEAWRRLSDFIDDCIRRGNRKALIIHGKGNHTANGDGVLGEVVRAFIEHDPHCGASGHPDRRHGGNGATWVALKY